MKKATKCMYLVVFELTNGAEGRNRTGDPRVTSALLYQLSYFGLREACGL